MDQGALVIEQIDAGTQFIDRLDEHVRVRAAFWLKASDEGRWYLYIASNEIDDRTIEAAYAKVSRVAREMGNPNLDPFQIKLIGSDDPLARAALDVHHRFIARVPTRFKGKLFGGMSVEEVYIYPPPPYGSDEEKWRSIWVRVWPELKPEGAYRVEFWPHEMASMVLPGGQPKRVSRPAAVLVKEGQVIEYRAPEKVMSHLSQSDYEAKAREAVEQVATK